MKKKTTKYFDYNAPLPTERIGTKIGDLKRPWVEWRRWYFGSIPVILKSEDGHEFFGRPKIFIFHDGDHLMINIWGKWL